MYANKFAEGYANMRLEEGHRKVSRTPSPRDVVAGFSSSSQQAVCCLDGPVPGPAPVADCLASRISFYMDDAVISSTDEVRDVSPALSRQASSSRGQPPRGLYAPKAGTAGSSPSPSSGSSHARRSRSFRLEGRDEPQRPRLYRHGSDIGPGGGGGGGRRSSTRSSKRSGSGRRSAGGSGGATPERGGSVRSASHHHHHHHHHRSGSARRKASSASRLSVGHAAAAGSPSSPHARFPLPHADLPPKERRRRLVVLIVVVTFMFLVVCSVLTVVVTLTHSSFQKSPDTVLYEPPATVETVRKENEELMSAISRGGMYNNSAASSTPLEVSSTPDP